MSHQDVAQAFSNGKFRNIYQYFADDIEWTVVGECYFKGKQAVVENCEQVSIYFNSVNTVFKTFNVVVDKDKVAINGTGEFLKGSQRLSFVSACDVYEFDRNKQLKKVTSYCIQH